MKKITPLLAIFTIFWLFDFPFTVYAGVSATQSYQISVTIPAVVGLNVFPEGQSVQKFSPNSEQNISKEVVNRAGQEVEVETVVLK